MTRIACIAVSIVVFTGVTAHAGMKTDFGEGKIRQKRSNTMETRLERRAANTGGKEVSFEVLRMLSTGMSKAEVVGRAGPPWHTFQRGRSSTWVYATTDRWIVELAFGGGRVASINWTRP
jgi:hypothetical protein